MFWDNLKAACERKHVKVTPILNELKISSGSIGKWQKGGNVSSETLLKLSDRLDVSVDFLLKGEQPAASVSAPECASLDERDLLTMYRALPQQIQINCLNFVRGSYETYSVLQGERTAG